MTILFVTINTAVIYFSQVEDDDLKPNSYAVISDSNVHTSAMIKVFNQKILEYVAENFITFFLLIKYKN